MSTAFAYCWVQGDPQQAHLQHVSHRLRPWQQVRDVQNAFGGNLGWHSGLGQPGHDTPRRDARPVLHGTGGPAIVGGHLLRVLLMHWHLQRLGGVGHAVRCGHVCVALQVGDDLLQCVGVALWQSPCG